MLSRLPFSLLSAIAWMRIASAIPADPTITAPPLLPRQADANYIGWVNLNSTWTTQRCDEGNTWYQSGEYAQCCPDTVEACPAPTACIDGSQIYPLEGTTITTACTENFRNTEASICNTAFIYDSFGDPNPKTDIICGPSSVNWSYYRQVPASVSASPTPAADSDSGSKVWIAGVVVGPIVGIALIAGVIFFLMRRRKNKNRNTNLPQAGGAAMGPPPFTDAKPQLNPTGVNDYYNQQGYAQQQPTSSTGISPGYNPAAPHPQPAELGGTSPMGGQSHTAELPTDPSR